MTNYYVEYPRDFANEYNVYAVAAEDRADFERSLPAATRISRDEAIRLGWGRVREAKRGGEQWFGGFFDDTLSRPTCTLDEKLAECREATARLVASNRAIAEAIASGEF